MAASARGSFLMSWEHSPVRTLCEELSLGFHWKNIFWGSSSMVAPAADSLSGLFKLGTTICKANSHAPYKNATISLLFGTGWKVRNNLLPPVVLQPPRAASIRPPFPRYTPTHFHELNAAEDGAGSISVYFIGSDVGGKGFFQIAKFNLLLDV